MIGGNRCRQLRAVYISYTVKIRKLETELRDREDDYRRQREEDGYLTPTIGDQATTLKTLRDKIAYNRKMRGEIAEMAVKYGCAKRTNR